MRVRIQRDANNHWEVQVLDRGWYNFWRGDWRLCKVFVGDEARERAREYATRLKHPETEEIE